MPFKVGNTAASAASKARSRAATSGGKAPKQPKPGAKKRGGGAGAASARMDISDEDEEEEEDASESEADDDEDASESSAEESASDEESGSGSGESASGDEDEEGDEEEAEDESADASDEAEENEEERKNSRKKPAKKTQAAAAKKAAAVARAAPAPAPTKGRKRTRDEDEQEEQADAEDAPAVAASSSAAASSSSRAAAASPSSPVPPSVPQKSRGSTRQIRKPAASDDNFSDNEQKPKRRSTAAASSSSAAAADSSAVAASSSSTELLDPDELSDEWRCNANQSVFFRLVRPAPEKDSRAEQGQGAPTETLQFHPHYTHQLWDDEEIVGYKKVKCVVAFTSGALYTYLHVEWDDRVRNAGIPDIMELVGAKLKGGYTTSWSDFQSHIHDAFVPPGEKVAEYSLPSVEENKKESISYEIYRGTFSDATLRAYHARLQFFLLFFIDRSSYINDSDLVWEVILLFQKRVCLAKQATTYHIVGYTTLYKFLHYPNDWKMRLSQILILPPYQRAGHGQRLLQFVYAEAERRKMIEVNIEDPSPVFQMLRDLTDIQLCKKHKFFEKNGSFDFDPLEVWNLDYAKKVKTALRITLAQVRRCYEIFKLNQINDRHKHSKAMTAYRLEVKARIFREEAEVLSLYSSKPEDRKEKLQEIYKELEEHYLAVIKKARLH